MIVTASAVRFVRRLLPLDVTLAEPPAVSVTATALAMVPSVAVRFMVLMPSAAVIAGTLTSPFETIVRVSAFEAGVAAVTAVSAVVPPTVPVAFVMVATPAGASMLVTERALPVVLEPVPKVTLTLPSVALAFRIVDASPALTVRVPVLATKPAACCVIEPFGALTVTTSAWTRSVLILPTVAVRE